MPTPEPRHTTHVFKNGNSQAVRIPKDLAYDRNDLEVEVERIGDEIRIRPARRRLDRLLDRFAAFSPDFMTGGREDEDQDERETL